MATKKDGASKNKAKRSEAHADQARRYKAMRAAQDLEAYSKKPSMGLYNYMKFEKDLEKSNAKAAAAKELRSETDKKNKRGMDRMLKKDLKRRMLKMAEDRKAGKTLTTAESQKLADWQSQQPKPKKAQVKKLGGIPDWKDFKARRTGSFTEKMADRIIVNLTTDHATYEKLIADMNKGNYGEFIDPKDPQVFSEEKKAKIRAYAIKRRDQLEQQITRAHGKKATTTIHGGLKGMPKFLKMPKMGTAPLVPLIWLDEYIETGKTPAMVADFMKIPQLPQMFKEAFKEIKDAKRNRDEKAAKSVLSRLQKKNKDYFPVKKRKD